jgi:hypothetical protein
VFFSVKFHFTLLWWLANSHESAWAYGKEKIRGAERNLPDFFGLYPSCQKNFPEKLSKIVVDGWGGGVWRHWRTSTNVFTTSWLRYSSTIRTIRRLFADYSYYSSTIRVLFVLFVDYSRTIRTIRRLFADYSYYSSTIRRLFVLFVDYSHYSLHYSSFINCLYT